MKSSQQFRFKGTLLASLVCTLAAIMVVACAKNDSAGAPLKGSGHTPTPSQESPTQPPVPGAGLPGTASGADQTPGTTNVASTNVAVSADKLVAQLNAKADALPKDATQMTANQNLASSIQAVESKVNSTTNAVKVLITGKDASQQNLVGSVNNGASALAPADSNSTSTGSFICQDQDQADHMCKVAIVDLKSSTGAETMAIIRHTNATMNLNNDKNPVVASADYQTLKNIFSSTLAGSTASSTVRTILFNSSEVAHGSTFVHLTIVMNDNQVIGLSGALQSPAAGMPFTEGILAKNIRSEDVSDLIADPANIKHDLQDLIQGAQILKVENGLDFTLLIDVKGNDAEPRQTVSLKLSREDIAVQDLK